MHAIVFACDRFDAYIYGRREVNVETDHQLLEMIVRKPLNNAPKRLQRMLLQLQKYDLTVRYKKGKLMHLADTLSRAYLPNTRGSVAALEIASIDHTTTLSLPAESLHRFKHVSADDQALCELRRIIQQGWPTSKSEVTETLHPYYDFRDELTTQDQLVFKGPLVVVPAALRKEMMAACHITHIGIEGCIRRARESMFWPRMATELKTYISKCDICMAHRMTPQKETLCQHEFAPHPWAKVGADLCELHGCTLLLVCDYFSNYIEVESLQTTTTRAVCKAMKALFACYGVPEVLMTDNGQFTSTEFRAFSRAWSFEHQISSPHYPQSNGKAENAVRTVKRLFTKCREAGLSEFQALLDWRNTPTEGVGTSPAQRFLGRRCRTLLPMFQSQLIPQYPTEDAARALQGQKAKQQQYYNRNAKDLSPILTGETARMRLPGQSTWTPGVCTGPCGPQSYGVKVGDRQFRRNRRQLLLTREPLPPDSPPEQQTPEDHPTEGEPSSRVELEELDTPEVSAPPVSPTPTPTNPGIQASQLPRRSMRNRKPPDWITTYVHVHS